MSGLKFTEKELDQIVKSGKISILSSTKSKNTKSGKISLSGDSSVVQKKSSQSVNINTVIQSIKLANIRYSVSEDHLSLIFDDAILLSVNQIFAFLQREKQQIFFFMYKKAWHLKIYEALIKIISDKQILPFFEQDVEITLLRQAPKEIDLDAITTMFKFIIDGLKKTQENPKGILAEDNPKVVHSILFHNEKGNNLIGIKIKRVKKDKKSLSAEELLIK